MTARLDILDSRALGEIRVPAAQNAKSSARGRAATVVDLEERRLVAGVRAGNRRAQRAFYERFQQPVRGHLYRVLGTGPDVDDALQTVFVRAFAGIDGFKGESAVRTWLYRITLNTARNVMRHRFRQTRLKRAFHCFNKSRAAHLYESPASVHDDARRMLLLLKPKLREVFVLYHHEGFNLREIAEIIGRPVSTVGDRLVRARRQLQAIVRSS